MCWLAEVRNDGERVGEYQYNALGQRVAKTSRYRGRLHAHVDQGNRTEKPVSASSSKGKGQTKGQGPIPDSKPKRQGNLHSHYDNKPVTERLHFHYDQQGNVIAESDNQGNIVREYIYLGNYRIAMTARSLGKPGMSPSVIPTGTPEGRGVEGSLALYYLHNDHLGTPQNVTDTDQRIVWSMEQSPFGEVTLTTESIRMPMRFPGQYADVESGFSYNYFRDYDPSLGRYIQSDPIGLLRDELNTYSYVKSNPVLNVDITGLASVSGGVSGTVFEGNVGGNVSFFGGVDSNFKVCFQIRTCGLAGFGVSGGFGKSVRISTANFCPGEEVTFGMFGSEGTGAFSQATLTTNTEDIVATGTLGAGGGASGGSMVCITRTRCIN